jgi:hypothetical protein
MQSCASVRCPADRRPRQRECKARASGLDCATHFARHQSFIPPSVPHSSSQAIALLLQARHDAQRKASRAVVAVHERLVLVDEQRQVLKERRQERGMMMRRGA